MSIIPENNGWKKETTAQTAERLRRVWGDYPLTILIINPVNIRLARLAGRTSITPNQLTIISCMIAVVSACCMASVNPAVQAAGGILLLISFLIDCLDGDLARLKGLKSPLGAMLDPILDRIGEFAVITGMAIGGWRETGNPGWLIGGIILAGMSQIYFYITDLMLNKLRPPDNKPERVRRELTINGTRIRFGVIEPFIWGQAAFALMGKAVWGIPVFAAMFTVASLIQLIRLIIRLRRAGGNDPDEYTPHAL
jgi:phosphatidylglycerophosphate synthase